MNTDRNHYDILIIEANPGDFVLIDEYIEEGFRSARIKHLKTIETVEALFSSDEYRPDVVLLDIAMGGKDYSTWVETVINWSDPAPVLLLTGYTHIPICVSMLSLGASDYLLKDELDEKILSRSIIYNIERKSFVNRIRESQRRYRDLFHLSPQPMFVIDTESLRFVDVNKSAIKNYGYTREEFLAMTIRGIRPPDDADATDDDLRGDFDTSELAILNHTKHRRKNGDIIYVEVRSSQLYVNNKDARLVLATDVTDRYAYISAIEKQNQKLRDIAWVQSHVVRAPLARLLGIIQMIEDDSDASAQTLKLLKLINDSAHELDAVIHDVAKKAELINIDSR